MSEPVDKKEARRLLALKTWAGRASAAGHLVPAADELTAIATNPNAWSEHANSDVAAAWAPTIDHLLHQLKFGVDPIAAVDQLPSEITTPTRDLTPPPPAASARVPDSSAPSIPARDKDLVPGATVADGRYRLRQFHGGPPYLQFWQALDIPNDRQVALTLVDPENLLPSDAVAKILDRTMKLADIARPGLARIVDVTRTGSTGVVVSEWTRGGSLAEVAETRPSALGAARATQALAAAAEAAHGAGVPLSIDDPARIRVDNQGDVVLAFPATLSSATPEDDVRGIGATLYALLANAWPMPEKGAGSGLAPADVDGEGRPRELHDVDHTIPPQVSAAAVHALIKDGGIRTAGTLLDALRQATSVADQAEDATTRLVTVSVDEAAITAHRATTDQADPPLAREPAPEPPDRNAALVDELMKWRGAHITKGTDGADAIKDATLRNLVKFNHTDAEQIGKRIPGPAAHLATEIASIMARFGAGPTPEARSPVAPPTAPESDGRPASAPAPATTAPPPSPVQTQEASSPPITPPPIRLQDRSGARHTRADGIPLDLDHSDFCAYEYGDSDVEPTRVAIKSTPDGVRLAFDAHSADAGKMVIYRVVSGENSPPFKPEAGDIVAVTTDLQVDDPRFPVSAVRSYQVWCHVGIDREDACRTQPFLLATGEQVSPVDDFQIAEDEGRVIGRWSVFAGTDAVELSRIPLSGNVNTSDEEQFRICADDLNLTGFVDTTAERGQRYLYRARAKVTVGDAQRLSAPSQQELLVSVVLQPVEDLEVLSTQGKDEFDLRWTTPDAGDVRVYRLKAPPPGDLVGKDVPEAALQPQGLTAENRINYPVTAAGPGTAQMRGVPWPADWQRAYLVPVTVLNGVARVGKTQITNRALPPVAEAEIIERYHTEIVTFGWPEGAASVKAFVGLESMAPEEICSTNPATEEINKARYERDGGLTFTKPLAAAGCTVCLVPVAYSRAQEVRGRITALRYRGLIRVDYRFVRTEGSSVARLQMISTNIDVDLPPPIVLINNESRFPLSPDDGTYVNLRPPGGGDAVPQYMLDRISRDVADADTGVTVDLSAVHGFYRLFFGAAGGDDRPFALHDPALVTEEPTVCSLWRDRNSAS